MKSLADGLPPEITQQVHPDWRKNETAYWDIRESLLDQYRGKWIAFSSGRVIASGTRPVLVLQASHQSGVHPFVICVGREEEPYRMRRAAYMRKNDDARAKILDQLTAEAEEVGDGQMTSQLLENIRSVRIECCGIVVARRRVL